MPAQTGEATVTTSYDVIVVGLGAMGSATAYELAKRGQRVLGIDMYTPGHDQGSSHGHHRLIRKSSFRSDGYVPLAERAFELWRALEGQTGSELLKILGEVRLAMLNQFTEPDPTLAGMVEVLDERRLGERFPGFRLHEGMVATYEAEAGFLRPEACIAAHLELAEQHGATLHHSEEVTAWKIEGDGVRVETNKGSYSAGQLAITTGPWASELLVDLNLPMTVVRIVNGYFEPSRPDLWKAENGAPDFLLGVPEGSYYGMPSIDGSGLKIGRHENGEITTARTIRRTIDESEIDMLRNVLDLYMPGASGALLQSVTCMYTNSVDDDFIVDRHPEHQQVVFGCGFSGRGFKFSGVVGEILAELLTEGATRHDIEFLSARRFGQQPAKVF
jgi:sarcosine oxidase